MDKRRHQVRNPCAGPASKVGYCVGTQRRIRSCVVVALCGSAMVVIFYFLVLGDWTENCDAGRWRGTVFRVPLTTEM